MISVQAHRHVLIESAKPLATPASLHEPAETTEESHLARTRRPAEFGIVQPTLGPGVKCKEVCGAWE